MLRKKRCSGSAALQRRVNLDLCLQALGNDMERERRGSAAASSIVKKQCNPEPLQRKDDCRGGELRKGG